MGWGRDKSVARPVGGKWSRPQIGMRELLGGLDMVCILIIAWFHDCIICQTLRTGL